MATLFFISDNLELLENGKKCTYTEKGMWTYTSTYHLQYSIVSDSVDTHFRGKQKIYLL